MTPSVHFHLSRFSVMFSDLNRFCIHLLVVSYVSDILQAGDLLRENHRAFRPSPCLRCFVRREYLENDRVGALK